MNELSVAAKLDSMRAELPGFLDLSFPDNQGLQGKCGDGALQRGRGEFQHD